MSEAQLRAGFYDPTMLRWTDCPQGIPQIAWNEAGQAGRHALRREAIAADLPDAMAMTSDELSRWVSTCALTRYEVRQAADAEAEAGEVITNEVEWGRTREELFNFRETDREEYNRLYAALTPEQKANYHLWEPIRYDMWSEQKQEEARASAAQKGLPAWEDLFALSLNSVAEDSEYQKALDEMTPEEQRWYYEWEIGHNTRMVNFSSKLLDMWEGGERQEHWQLYRQLTPVERVYYSRWMAATLAEQTQDAQPPMDDLYDVFVNSGGGRSPILGLYASQVLQAMGDNPKNRQWMRGLGYQFAERASASRNALEQVVNSRTPGAAEQVGQQFQALLALRGQDWAKYERALDALPWNQFRAYTLWEGAQDWVLSSEQRAPIVRPKEA